MDPHNQPEMETSSLPVEVLPLNRVKRLMKEEADVKAVSAEASYTAARATEFLIEELAARAFQLTNTDKRDTISYGDVATTVSSWHATQFLKDIVPQRLPLSEIIKRVRSAEAQAQSHPAMTGEEAHATMHAANGREETIPEENGSRAHDAQQFSAQPAAVHADVPMHGVH